MPRVTITTSSDELLSARGLVVGYPSRSLCAPFDWTIERGQMWAVVGANGTGKTTLFRTLLGLQPPRSGQVERRPGLRLHYLAQRTGFDPLYPLTAAQVVALGGLRGLRGGGPAGVSQALTACRAAELAQQPFRTLSEGQKQRVLMARLLHSQPELAFLDEPTAAMDESTAERTMGQLAELTRERGIAVVVILHDLALARRHAQHTLRIRDGRVERT